MAFDLAQFDSRKHADAGVDFPLINIVTGEKVIGNDGQPVTFRLGHWDGLRIRAAVNARRKQRNETKSAAAAVADTEEQREREAADDLAAMTMGWSDNFDLDGQPCAFSHDSAAELYFRFRAILDQMAQNAADRGNFMLAAAGRKS